MYICVKLPSEDLNPDPCSPHPTSTYICRITITPRVYDDIEKLFKLLFLSYFIP